MKTSFFVLGGLLLAGLVTGLPQTRSWGCAPVPPEGYGVSILKEFALIVWEPASKIEHFIRVADFDTDAPEMGFLVPTPTVPELFEVDGDALAAQLRRNTKARRVIERSTVTKFGLGPWRAFTALTGVSESSPTPGGVDVIAQYDVAGYEASVLRADDPQLLKTWLADHGYVTRDSIEAWLKIYTDQEWIITAFKVSQSKKSGSLKTHAVRMTFPSEQPFYPYREPHPETHAKNQANQPSGSPGNRLLRVFLLADQRYEATIGRDQKWHAKTVFSKHVESFATQAVARSLSVDAVPMHLTEFEDHASPRPGFDELYFRAADDQTVMERPPVIIRHTTVEYFPGWGGAILIVCVLVPLSAGGIGGYYWLQRHRG